MDLLAASQAITLVFAYLLPRDQVKMQALSRRFYYKLIPQHVHTVN